MDRKTIISGNLYRADIHEAIEGKTIRKMETVVNNKEIRISFTDGTALRVAPHENHGVLQGELYELPPAQTKISLTAWREYRQFDGDLVECFEKFFHEFWFDVEDSRLTGTNNRYHDWNSYHWGKLQNNVIEDLRAGIELQKLGRVRDTNQFSLEWDFEGTNKREETDILFTASFWVLGCDVSYDSPVLSSRIYLLPADQVNATEKMGNGR